MDKSHLENTLQAHPLLFCRTFWKDHFLWLEPPMLKVPSTGQGPLQNLLNPAEGPEAACYQVRLEPDSAPYYVTLFRTRITPEMLSLPSHETVKDEHSRPLKMTFGCVSRQPPRLEIPEEFRNRLRAAAQEHLRKVWETPKHVYPEPQPSDLLDLPLTVTEDATPVILEDVKAPVKLYRDPDPIYEESVRPIKEIRASTAGEKAAQTEKYLLERLFKNEQGKLQWGKVTACSLGMIAIVGGLAYLWSRHQQKRASIPPMSWIERVATKASYNPKSRY